MDDVLVVGGGPTGFITALGLAQAGAEVTLIEAEPKIIDSPRAAVYHWSVLQGFDQLGILAEAEEIGFTKQDYTCVFPSLGERIEYDMSVLEGHTAYPYNVHLGQDRLADIARRRLEVLPNARVRFDTRLVALEQDAGGVTVRTEGKRGPEEMRARWLVGADGAGSNVRRLLGLSFDGMTWPERFIATNVYYDFDKQGGYGLTTLAIDDRHGAVIVLISKDGLWRCTYMEDASLPEETYLERLPDAYKGLLPGDGDYVLERAAPYRMHQRSAPRYRVGRVVLAGDAAHVTNPTGGLGLTTGLFDAFALHPTLAAVLDGADDELLDRYSEDRRDRFLHRTSPQAIANKQLVFHGNGGGEKLKEAATALRRLETDPDFRLERLLFTRGLESPPLT